MDFLSASQSGLRAHSVDAVRVLWGQMLEIRAEHSDLMVFERIYIEEEKQDAFKGKVHAECSSGLRRIDRTTS